MTDQIAPDFERFHRENPHVYDLFDRFARRLVASGETGFGAKALWERLRWEVRVETRSSEKVRLNNNYTALYARLWMERNPEHAGFFRTRQRQSSTANSVRLGPDAEEDLLSVYLDCLPEYARAAARPLSSGA
ncbi:hypothetical protein P1J78_15275 [Psychromarinibacter sp. C21-152]|uniref:Uncharacterized protein n=1 Tax=Psychromarinibacter sediminicola TaxID=3033385 RepID=A0AAE3NU83_9RHOB|nr:hypothetical protein [Psychromarinibacter sediminicola]MDF0602101.1 hypothetical protein [Psychromarinibacter sediminicola]